MTPKIRILWKCAAVGLDVGFAIFAAIRVAEALSAHDDFRATIFALCLFGICGAGGVMCGSIIIEAKGMK